jgi:hypothetical protein
MVFVKPIPTVSNDTDWKDKAGNPYFTLQQLHLKSPSILSSILSPVIPNTTKLVQHDKMVKVFSFDRCSIIVSLELY